MYVSLQTEEDETHRALPALLLDTRLAPLQPCLRLQQRSFTLGDTSYLVSFERQPEKGKLRTRGKGTERQLCEREKGMEEGRVKNKS